MLLFLYYYMIECTRCYSFTLIILCVTAVSQTLTYTNAAGYLLWDLLKTLPPKTTRSQIFLFYTANALILLTEYFGFVFPKFIHQDSLRDQQRSTIHWPTDWPPSGRWACLLGGSLLSDTGTFEQEVKRRIAIGRATMLKKVWCDSRMSRKTKICLVQSLVFLIFSWTWTIKAGERNSLSMPCTD